MMAMRAVGQRGMGETAGGPRWFVVQTQLFHEKRAARELRQQGFEVYLPIVHGHPKSKNPIQPLFPRYLFVRFDPRVAQWLAICSTLGVSDLLRNGTGKPLAMRDAWISKVRGQESEGFVGMLETPKAAHAKGDRLKVVAGALSGFDAVFDRHLSVKGRIMVLLKLLGGETPVELMADQVQPDQPSPPTPSPTDTGAGVR